MNTFISPPQYKSRRDQSSGSSITISTSRSVSAGACCGFEENREELEDEEGWGTGTGAGIGAGGRAGLGTGGLGGTAVFCGTCVGGTNDDEPIVANAGRFDSVSASSAGILRSTPDEAAPLTTSGLWRCSSDIGVGINGTRGLMMGVSEASPLEHKLETSTDGSSCPPFKNANANVRIDA